MLRTTAVRGLLLATALATCTVASVAFAQVNLYINTAPPAPQYEPAPVLQPGYAWAPGYWTWHGDRYIWIRGRMVAQRTGYRWEPDRWEQRDGRYFRHEGRWERDPGYRVVKAKKEKIKYKKEKKEKHHGKH